MDINEISTKELIKALSKRKGVQHVDAGTYQNFEVVGKYEHHGIEFPGKYELLIIKHIG